MKQRASFFVVLLSFGFFVIGSKLPTRGDDDGVMTWQKQEEHRHLKTRLETHKIHIRSLKAKIAERDEQIRRLLKQKYLKCRFKSSSSETDALGNPLNERN